MLGLLNSGKRKRLTTLGVINEQEGIAAQYGYGYWALIMSAAHAAMYVNERGTDETLIFPFYSAENGNNTNINIANTTSQHG